MSDGQQNCHRLWPGPGDPHFVVFRIGVLIYWSTKRFCKRFLADSTDRSESMTRAACSACMGIREANYAACVGSPFEPRGLYIARQSLKKLRRHYEDLLGCSRGTQQPAASLEARALRAAVDRQVRLWRADEEHAASRAVKSIPEQRAQSTGRRRLVRESERRLWRLLARCLESRDQHVCATVVHCLIAHAIHLLASSEQGEDRRPRGRP